MLQVLILLIFPPDFYMFQAISARDAIISNENCMYLPSIYGIQLNALCIY